MTYLTQEESFEDTILDTKKSVLNSLIKKLKVDQDGLVEIDFCVALGHTPYGVLPRTTIKSNSKKPSCSTSTFLSSLCKTVFTFSPPCFNSPTI